jgi:hypothetical protein
MKTQSLRWKMTPFLLIALFLLCSCGGRLRELSVDDVLDANILTPVHRPDPSSDHGDLRLVYYYLGDYSEVLLVTYFLEEDSENQEVRVARMFTCRNCDGPYPDEIQGKAASSVTWARGGTGVCRVANIDHEHLAAYERDYVDGEPFQSCLFWVDENGIIYRLYTVWQEDESVDFANSLLVLEE